MNPITKALDEIQFEIPAEILREIFIDNSIANCGQVISLDTRIREDVIQKRVLPDLDLHGGTEAYLPLYTQARITHAENYSVIYEIPESMTQNRPIIEVYSIHFAVLGYQTAAPFQYQNESAMGAEARKVLDSAIRQPPAMTTYLSLIAHNTVMVRYLHAPYRTAFLRCRMGNDMELNSIRPASIPYFAELCVNAVKAHIYNTSRIKIGKGELHAGIELGVFKEIVEEYRDARDIYKEQRAKWRKMSVYNDPEARHRHLKAIIGIP